MSDTGILVTIEDADEFNSRVVLDYTNRDFTAIRAQLVGLARGIMPEWQTVGETGDFGTLLLELYAYMGDVLNFYIDRTASEAFLGTAVRRQSILYIADMLGYRPIGQQAASVLLDFTMDPNSVEAVTLPIGCRVYNDAADANDLIVFELNQAVTLDPDVGAPVLTGSAFATEGVSVDSILLAASLGIPNAEYVLAHKGVVFNSVSVTTEESGATLPWSFVSDISLARPTQAVFTTFLDDEGATHLLFGDNAAGRIPPVQANLFVSYRYGVGARANDLAPDSLVNIAAASVPPNTDLWGVSVRNAASPLGGTDPETVDAMRASIPRAAARIKSRAVTLNDYADLALQVPGVSKSVAHGTIYTAVHVRIAPQGGKATTEYMTFLCASVEDYMKDKIIVGSTVYAEPEDIDDLWSPTWLRMVVHVLSGFNRTSVRLQVEAIIRKTLSFDLVDFGTLVSIGKIYRTALAVQGVEYVQLMWLDDAAPTLSDDQDMAPITGNPTPTAGTVNDVAVDPLLIPMIDGSDADPVVETEVDFPGLTEEERTHDGLWIWAVGGVVGT
jgi:hypothetical protein